MYKYFANQFQIWLANDQNRIAFWYAKLNKIFLVSHSQAGLTQPELELALTYSTTSTLSVYWNNVTQPACRAGCVVQTPRPANVRYWLNVVILLVLRQWRWPSIEAASFQRLVFAVVQNNVGQRCTFVDCPNGPWSIDIYIYFGVKGLNPSTRLPPVLWQAKRA